MCVLFNLISAFILSIAALPDYPPWSTVVGWLIACSSMICVPLYVIYRFVTFRGNARQVCDYCSDNSVDTINLNCIWRLYIC